MAALLHVDRAQAEAKNVVLARLARALAVALTVDQLLVDSAFLDVRNSGHNAGAVMVDHTVGADRSAYVALGDHEGRWALREPLLFALLAVVALAQLAVASPQRQGFCAASLSLLKELRAAPVDQTLRLGRGHRLQDALHWLVDDLLIGGRFLRLLACLLRLRRLRGLRWL